MDGYERCLRKEGGPGGAVLFRGREPSGYASKECGMTFAQLACIAAIWLLGGFVHGVTSIGGGMIAMPVVTFLTTPRDAILISCLTGFIMPLALAIIYRRHILWREVIFLALGCIPGIPAGLVLLTTVSGPVLLFGVGVMLIFFVSWQYLSRRMRPALPYKPLYAFIAGVAGAFLTSCTSLGGPVLAVYAAFRGWEKENALASTSMYFNFLNVGLIFGQWHAGLYSESLIGAVSVSLPSAVLGVLISIPVVRRMPQQAFRKLLLGMILLSGLVLIYRSIV